MVSDSSSLPGLPVMDGPFDRPAMAKVLSCFFAAGATLGLVSIALPGHPGSNIPGMLGVVAVSYSAAALLFFGARRLPRHAIDGFFAFGTLLITVAVYFDGHGPSAFGLFYIWVGMMAFYFLSRTQAFVQLAFVGLAYGAVLAMVPNVVPFQRWLLTLGTATVGGLVISFLGARICALVARLTDAARTDPLTGLLNRRALEELFQIELDRARRSGHPLSVVVGDLDGFKAVNDRLGHRAGDHALQELADELNKWKRRIDVAARMGGEEFALLLPETDERGAFLVAERLRRATHRCFSEGPLPLTISFGVASFPDHGDDAETLLHAADRALYAAKDLGKDRTVIYSAEVARMLSAGHSEADASELQLATVISLAEALDIRDTGSVSHSHTVGRHAEMIAEALGFDPEHVERVRLAGVLHDVGKIGLADVLVAKPGPLDEEEWREMHTHPEIACRLLSHPELADLREWILAHHERVDGKGYPRGLAGEAIPLEARILAVADAYEAMTADRVYRPALGDQAARVELTAGCGAQFDEAVVEVFLDALDRQAEHDLALPEPTVTK